MRPVPGAPVRAATISVADPDTPLTVTGGPALNAADPTEMIGA